MTERAYGRYIDYVNVESKNVMVEIRVLQNETEINGEKILMDKWLLPEQWQELYNVLHTAADKHINENCDNVVKVLGNTIRIVLKFESFLPAYQYILKPYKCNIDDLEECLHNPGPEWMETHPYEFMIKAVISPVNMNFGNSLSTGSNISESDVDERLGNKTERNVEDTQVSESDSDSKSAISSKLQTSFIIPESDSDDSLPDYSQPIPTFDSQNMCYTEKFSKYSGLPSRVYEGSLDFSQCDNKDNLNVPYSQAKCLNGEKISPKSSSSKCGRSLENVFGGSSHATGKLDFQNRNKRRKIIATEALDVVGVNTSGCGDVESFPEIRKWEVTQSSSKKIKVNESEAGALLKPVLQNSAKNKRGKHKICNLPDFSRKPLYRKCKSSASESSVNLSVKTKKHLQVKTPKDESENSPQKERKSHHQKLPKRVKEKSHLNTTSKAGAHIEESNEILERKKFRVSHLSLKELENEYKKHKNNLVEIFNGKQSSWRHDEFCKGRATLQDLRFSVSTIPFTDEQLHHLLFLLRQTFCQNCSFVPYFDYFMKVLLPEVTTYIFMDLFSLSREEVLGKLRQLYISSNEPVTFGI